MNKNITEEELLLRKRARRRLVGAIVLTVTAIIVLPMMFDEPRPDAETHEIDIHLFPKDDDINTEQPLVLPSEDLPPIASDQVSGESNPELDSSQEFSTPLESPNQLSVTDEHDTEIQNGHIPIPGIKPQLTVVQTEVKQPVHTASEYVIQLGAFSDQTKARQQLDILRSNGLDAYMETHRVNNTVVTRVRIGRFLDRDAAENELDKLRKLGLNGVVTPK